MGPEPSADLLGIDPPVSIGLHHEGAISASLVGVAASASVDGYLNGEIHDEVYSSGSAGGQATTYMYYQIDVLGFPGSVNLDVSA